MTLGGVTYWWMFLCLVAALNIAMWSVSAAMLRHRRVAMPVALYAARRRQLLLSAAYVFGCAFRSAFPVFDIPRLCLFNYWISSVVVGRSVATVAELCFVTQWALMMYETAGATGSIVARRISLTIVPLIVIAEICSWTAVLTTSNLGHVFENSLWGISAALMVISMLTVWPRSAANFRPLLIAISAIAVAYVGYMFLVDVPMYWARWSADRASGRHYLTLAQGLADVATRQVVSHRWEDWKSEALWMSLYFSVAVWVSISLIHVPPARARRSR